jgi:radical SAM superfamily enzyme
MGLESGNDEVLRFMDKGETPADHIAGGKKIVASGISLCTYVMPGAGGKKLWKEHALETARMLNEINPGFIRFRTLTVQPRMLLHADVTSGAFVRASDEEVVEEMKLLVENLDCQAQIVSDHMINLLPEIEGKLPGDKQKMLAVIHRFQTLALDEKENYKLGRRLGVYSSLEDLHNPSLRSRVNEVLDRLSQNGQDINDDLLFYLMERYI